MKLTVREIDRIRAALQRECKDLPGESHVEISLPGRSVVHRFSISSDNRVSHNESHSEFEVVKLIGAK